MHDIEPFWNWRHKYTSEEDERSPFFGEEHSEIYFTQAIYNHLIHPQWDNFGSSTLYLKIIFAEYEDCLLYTSIPAHRSGRRTYH